MAAVDVLESNVLIEEASPPKPTELFTSHYAQVDAGPMQFTVRALKMPGSTLLFVNSKEEVLEELALAMPSRDPASKDVLSTTILGGYGQTESSVLATKLSKRYQRPFYVSFNLKVDRLVGPLFEKALVTYMRDHLEHFV
ncbi:uncharacterized protein [Drosophila bipectinata]|uniref:uncharacterized protein n=1 Tax=Drosophila bipectinata TaxID=42026 RepID=UPI001C8A3176|nr:uncharacterized protein LOC108119252 [Drosophila bipectinata]XP_043066340.1 uncharacterized protein LOC108119252 [Drosophila bipectinata]